MNCGGASMQLRAYKNDKHLGAYAKYREFSYSWMEENFRYYCQFHHNYLPPPLPPNSYWARGGGEKKGGRTSETQSHSHSCSFTSRPVIRGITSRMQGLEVNKSAVKGYNFDTEVVYYFSQCDKGNQLTTLLALLPY